MGGDTFSGMAEFFGDFKASGLIGIRAGRRSAPHWRGLASKLLVAVVGVAVAQAVAGEAVCPRDPAGPQDVVVVVFDLGQGPGRVAGAGASFETAKVLAQSIRARLSGVSMGTTLVPPAFGSHRQGQTGAFIRHVRAQPHPSLARNPKIACRAIWRPTRASLAATSASFLATSTFWAVQNWSWVLGCA